jgi:hypothetical protein
MNAHLKAGMTITVYQDPITRQKPEGEAKLLREYRPDEGDGLSMWVVEFVGEPGSRYVRTISTTAQEQTV